MSTHKKKQARRPKHIPQRSCVVCREKKDKRELTRIVNNQEEGVVIDPTGKKNGRGAYLCNSEACWHKAAHTNVLDQALKIPVTAETKAALYKQFQKEIEVMSHA